MTRRRATIATLALLAALTTHGASAMTVLPLDLAALTAGAGTIFVGRVVQVDPGTDERGIAAVWTTFEIDESLKGAPSSRVTLKQLGTALAHGSFPNVPRFVPGESVVLFVHPVSALGFTSPVGLGQGTFRIREYDGQRVVENDRGDRDLAAAGARRARGSTASADPLPLETLLTRVRALVNAAP